MDESACFSQDEIARLDPAVARIIEKFECLSPLGQLSVIDIILSAVLFDHDLYQTFDPIAFLFGEGAQEQRQLAA